MMNIVITGGDRGDGGLRCQRCRDGEPVLRVGVEAQIRVAGFDVFEIEIVHASLCARWKGVVLLQLVLTDQKTLESRPWRSGGGMLLLTSGKTSAAKRH